MQEIGDVVEGNKKIGEFMQETGYLVQEIGDVVQGSKKCGAGNRK